MLNDFRPINMLPCIEKLTEKVVHNQFNAYITEDSILADSQSRLRSNYACGSALNTADCLNGGSFRFIRNDRYQYFN